MMSPLLVSTCSIAIPHKKFNISNLFHKQFLPSSSVDGRWPDNKVPISLSILSIYLLKLLVGLFPFYPHENNNPDLIKYSVCVCVCMHMHKCRIYLN